MEIINAEDIFDTDTDADEVEVVRSIPSTTPKADVPQRNATSDRKRASNIENGRKSMGPKTAKGKAQSSKNSLKHGLYQKSPAPIPGGPFAEDADDVREFVDGIVADLGPRDALELTLAKRIAHELLRGERLERVEGSLLLKVTSLRPMEWTNLRDDLEIARALVEYLEDPGRPRIGNWHQAVASFIVRNTPSWVFPNPVGIPPDRLSQALERLGDSRAAKEWGRDRVAELERLFVDQEPWDEGTAAERQVAEMAKLGTIGTQSSRNLQRLLADYRRLHERPMEAAGDQAD